MDTGTVFFGVTFVLHLLGFGISWIYDTSGGHTQGCPCEDPKFCERIKDTSRKEVSQTYMTWSNQVDLVQYHGIYRVHKSFC